MIIYQVRTLVAGSLFEFFNIKLLIAGAIYSLPFASILSLLFLIFNFIRHKYSVIQSLVPYCFFAVLVWSVIIPCCALLVPRSETKIMSSSVPNISLSQGYFRPYGNGVFFVLNDEVEVSNSDEIIETVATISFSKFVPNNMRMNVKTQKTFPETSLQFNDALINQVFDVAKSQIMIFSSLKVLATYCVKTLSSGVLAYCLFATLGFSLASVIGLSRISNWRLINATIVLIGFILVLFINVVIYSGDLAKFIPAISGWMEWFPLAINCFIGLIFSVIGIINCIIKTNPNREVE